MPPTRPQRFHRRFLGRKTSGIALILVAELFAVLPLARRVHPFQENLTVPLDRRLDAVNLGDIHAHANNQGPSSSSRFGPPGNSDYTGRTVAARKTVKRQSNSRKPTPGSPSSGQWIERKAGGVSFLQVVPLTKIPWLVHGFSLRPGGQSKLDEKRVLNLGFVEWDSRENVLKNRVAFQAALGAGKLDLVALKQMHSDAVLRFDTPSAQPCHGDASITNHPELLLAVQTADCVPILLVDRKNRAIAAVHAGWRGTLHRIVMKTIGRMQMQFSTKAADLLAAIGPSIGGCCYEVGTEVAVEFRSQFPHASDWFDELRTGDEPNPLQWLNMMPPGHQPPPKNVLLDLRKANRAQLLDAGLGSKNIFVSDLCTACRRDLFFSYRKEGAMTGRHMAAIGMLRS
jgi:YfiH family protein